MRLLGTLVSIMIECRVHARRKKDVCACVCVWRMLFLKARLWREEAPFGLLGEILLTHIDWAFPLRVESRRITQAERTRNGIVSIRDTDTAPNMSQRSMAAL